MIRMDSDSTRKATKFQIGGHTFFFSYDTLVGYAGSEGNCRLENRWGNTTGKHMTRMGIREFPVVTKEELDYRIQRSLVSVGMNLLKNKITDT